MSLLDTRFSIIIKRRALKTAGWVTIGVGAYLVYKGSQLDAIIVKGRGHVIDAVFEVIDD